ncbi:hypothetical protein PENSPDRAFT_593343 [Peniophora sp. CONT]|nr:hypothetical protein PENSPDRAFT_593343 [Peniophora sp. CONT]
MLYSIGNYFYDRRTKFAKAAGWAGGIYVTGRYIVDRLDDVRRKVVEERSSRDGMRKRFRQNMEDISFTVMAHMPILAHNVLTDMDVETLTAELQQLSKSSRARVAPAPELQPPTHAPSEASQASVASSGELVNDSDARSDTGSMSIVSLSSPGDTSSTMADSQMSWVQPSETSSVHPPAQASSSSSEAGGDSMSSSVLSASNDSASVADLASSQASLTTKRKAEMWREVKMMTVTRTLTTLYSITLLSVFSHIQLSLLGRYKYVHSIIQLERDEEEREAFDATSIASLFFAPSQQVPDVEKLLSEDERSSLWRSGVDAHTEMKFLTLSWWILHVGWKDVGERVRRGVEEVFEGVSLKSKIGLLEFHRLIQDVRRRVEHEITFEGHERRINFTSTLLPPTASAVNNLLSRNGFPNVSGGAQDPAFTQLLEETRDVLASPDFALVLERGLDAATDVLVEGLRSHVFAPAAEDGATGEPTVRVAGMLPGLARWSALALNGLPNPLVDSLASLHEVSALSAIVYSDFGDHFP